jgi:hypothetical protein
MSVVKTCFYLVWSDQAITNPLMAKKVSNDQTLDCPEIFVSNSNLEMGRLFVD